MTRRLCILPPVLALVILAGCGGGPYSADVVLSPGLHRSPRAPFAYQVPEGWFDALQGSDSSRYHLWLVRNDYAASLTIEEMTLDLPARAQVERHGVRTAAEISRALGSATPSVLVLGGLDELALDGRTAFAFEQADTRSGDTTRVVVFGGEGRIFEAHAVAVGGRAIRTEVFPVQQRVLRMLRWMITSSS